MLKHPNLKLIENIQAKNFEDFLARLASAVSARVFVRTLNVQKLGTWRVYSSKTSCILPYVAMRTVDDSYNVYEVVGVHPSELKL
jgi:hypothetical protein